MPTAMSLTRGSEQMPACSGPSIAPGVPAGGAHHQRAFKAEVDAAASLGDAFPQAHEQKRRGDADSAAEHGEWHGPESDRSVGHVACPLTSFALQKTDPSVKRVARQHEHENNSLQHQHGSI